MFFAAGYHPNGTLREYAGKGCLSVDEAMELAEGEPGLDTIIWSDRSDRPPLNITDTSLPQFTRYIEPDDYGSCSHPNGHEWRYTGTAYGGDDPRWHGDGRCLCIHCGTDGDG